MGFTQFDTDGADDKKIRGGTDGTIIGNVGPHLTVTDRLDTSGTHGAITVGVTAVAARVGGANLAARKELTVFNNGSQTIYWGLSNAVTTSTGTPLFKNQTAVFPYGPNITVWLISGTEGQNVRVTEVS